MTKRMLIDASHAEETRVVVLDGNRLEDFDVETSTKRQLKGNIYLAKVVRVEPSLQAAFVEYGGNRHGFLAFSEIHPDYYQIPVADRQRLLELQAEEARREEEEADLELALSHGGAPEQPAPARNGAADAAPLDAAELDASDSDASEPWARPELPLLIAAERITAIVEPEEVAAAQTEPPASDAPEIHAAEPWARPELPRLVAAGAHDLGQPLADPSLDNPENDNVPAGSLEETDRDAAETVSSDRDGYANGDHANRDYASRDYDSGDEDGIAELPPPETMGGDHDGGDDQRERRVMSRFIRNYKIQEVIRRRQILLIQVVKEERGTKGAALTTYLSLAGRFGVLMPNSPRGGGISRKITSAADRRRLKEVMAELDIPRGMGMIVRTAGANRPKPEIKRDCEYLLRLWDDIREHTMKSVAPALIYEEASLIKRAIRDVYSRDIDEILVDGEEGWRGAHDFMRMLMPSHAKKVQLWRDGGQPLFARQAVESQLDAMLMPTVQLRSGGYLVINQAEALVAIDVNSGRSTRERNIEETALRTNLEAADEVARQLRLRDLAGLIVIDFIDMESKRHNAMVERRIKEALKNDRARIQVGHISHFGLLEMSRQRLRPSLAETSFIPCPHCGGTGHVRSTESAAIYVLRGIEDEGSKRRAAEIVVHVSTPVALYLLNHKRERLREIELRYTMKVVVAADDAQIAPQFRIDRVRVRSADDLPAVVVPDRLIMAPPMGDTEVEEEEDVVVAEEEDEDVDDERADRQPAEAREGGEETGGDQADRPRRKRRRRRGGRRDEARDDHRDEARDGVPQEELLTEAGVAAAAAEVPPLPAEERVDEPVAEAAPAEPRVDGEAEPGSTAAEEDGRGRRRGRRGGRRRRREGEGEISPVSVPGAEQPDLLPLYAGPTPADPFGGAAFDIFDVMDQVERQAQAVPLARPAAPTVVANADDLEPAPQEPIAHATTASPGAGVVEAVGLDAVSVAAPSDLTIPPVPHDAHPSAVPGPAPTSTDTSRAAEPIGAAHVPALDVEKPAEAAVFAVEAAAEETPAEPAASGAVPVEAAETHFVQEAAPAAEIRNVAAPEPAAEPDLSEPSVLTPANDVARSEPAIKPILVGADSEAPAQKKRGWWRR